MRGYILRSHLVLAVERGSILFTAQTRIELTIGNLTWKARGQPRGGICFQETSLALM